MNNPEIKIFFLLFYRLPYFKCRSKTQIFAKINSFFLPRSSAILDFFSRVAFFRYFVNIFQNKKNVACSMFNSVTNWQLTNWQLTIFFSYVLGSQEFQTIDKHSCYNYINSWIIQKSRFFFSTGCSIFNVGPKPIFLLKFTSFFYRAHLQY